MPLPSRRRDTRQGHPGHLRARRGLRWGLRPRVRGDLRHRQGRGTGVEGCRRLAGDDRGRARRHGRAGRRAPPERGRALRPHRHRQGPRRLPGQAPDRYHPREGVAMTRLPLAGLLLIIPFGCAHAIEHYGDRYTVLLDPRLSTAYQADAVTAIESWEAIT